MAMQAQTSRSTVYASWPPIPGGFWVMWEGPPYRPHSLGDGSKCRHGKGLKTVCLGLTRTSEYMSVSHGYSTIGGIEYGGCGEDKKEIVSHQLGVLTEYGDAHQ